MNNHQILTALGFQPNEHNPFYTTFDPASPEPPPGFFADPARAPLEEPYRAYRKAVAAALAEKSTVGKRVSLDLDRTALGYLTQLLARLPERDAHMGLGQFLTAWNDHDGFDVFPDASLESEISEWASETASHWFDDLLKTLEGLGFEFEDYAFDPYGYQNYLKGVLTGRYTRKNLERIEAELPRPLAEVVRTLYFEAARYDCVEFLLENPHDDVQKLLELIKRKDPQKHRALLLCVLAGDEGRFERHLNGYEPENLAEHVTEEQLIGPGASFSTSFDDRSGYLKDEAEELQRALRDFLEREQEVDWRRRLDWLAYRYNEGSLGLEPTEVEAMAA